MGMEDFQFLLGDVATAFREDAFWRGPDGAMVAIIGRFRIDPADVALAIETGLNTTQTWFWCDRAVIAGDVKPDLGDVLTIRGRNWEIVQRDEDDLGELGYRLIKSGPDAELVAASAELANGAKGSRGPGRPSRRAEIVSAFEAVAEAGLDLDQPMSRVFPAIRERITGCAAPRGAAAAGLGDKALRKTLAPLFEARRNRRPLSKPGGRPWRKQEAADYLLLFRWMKSDAWYLRRVGSGGKPSFGALKTEGGVIEFVADRNGLKLTTFSKRLSVGPWAAAAVPAGAYPKAQPWAAIIGSP